MSDRPLGFPVDTIRIGASDFRVLWEDGAWYRSANAAAQFDGVCETIRVCKEGCPMTIACRFLHEVAHGLIFFHEMAKNETLTEEQAANVASYEMMDFWRSNPEVFKWWSGLLEE